MNANEAEAAKRLTGIREESGLSVLGFSNSLFISLADLRNMESGMLQLDHQVLTALYYTYQISPLWMLIGEGDKILARKAGRSVLLARQEDEFAIELELAAIDLRLKKVRDSAAQDSSGPDGN